MILFDAIRDGRADWDLVTDEVMGGESQGSLALADIEGRAALRLTGRVSLANGGGFLQMARDMPAASGWDGLELDVAGNGEDYNLHLRTADLSRPWQSFRLTFRAGPGWSRVRLAFRDAEPHRTASSFDASRLRRIGLVAIGRAFEADLALSRMSLYGGN